MIIEPLLKFPDDIYDQLLPWSLEEARKVDLSVVLKTIYPNAWVVTKANNLVCIVAFIPSGTLVGNRTEILFLAGKALVTLRKSEWEIILSEFRNQVKTMGHTTARVHNDFTVGHKFVEFFGLRKTHEFDNYSYYGVN